jgi:hypothetical protein
MTGKEITQAAREICAQQAAKGFNSDHDNYMSGKYDHTVWMRLVERGIRKGIEMQAEDAVGLFKLGDTVTKKKGSQWTGKVVGFYSTSLTPIGYAVESDTEKGSVQIYPEAALAALEQSK